MSTREAIGASVSLAPIPARRIDAAEKARQLVTPRHDVTPTPPAIVPTPIVAAPMTRPSSEGTKPKTPAKPTARFAKLTTRVFPEQLEWLKLEATRYREQNPRAPRVTVEELTRVAIDHLREVGNLEMLIAKYRG